MMGFRTVAVVLVVGVLAGAFWWLDFRAASSESRAERQVTTYGSGASSRAEGVQPKVDLALYVSGSGDLKPLREALVRQLQSGPRVGQVTTLAERPERSDCPVLGVEVGGGEVLWTPVYARADLSVDFVYTSDGDLSWRGQKPVVMPGGGRPTVWADGRLRVVDATRGVTSRRAYQRHLGEQIAGEVSKSLDQVLASHPAAAGG